MCKCKTIAICLIHWPHELYVMPQVRCTYGGGCRVGAGGGVGIVSGKGFAAGGDAGSTGCDARAAWYAAVRLRPGCKIAAGGTSGTSNSG